MPEDTKAINETKTESWKDLLQDAMMNSDYPNMSKVIHGLNGTLDANSPNDVSQQLQHHQHQIQSQRIHKLLYQSQQT